VRAVHPACTAIRETRMSKRKAMTLALTSCVLLAMHGVASAQNTKSAKPKKVTYEQAWKLCKAALDKEGPMELNTRYFRGGACLAKYGYSF
jgi:hypothetical protein